MARKPAWKVEWEDKFRPKMLPLHPRSCEARLAKLLKRLTGLRSTMLTRSKQHDVACTITVDELREMAYEAYGTTCKYTGRILTVDNMVFDHIHPISKGGESSRENLHIISKFANTMKGSLSEADFLLLMEWLQKLPENLREDVQIRLARGLR